MQLPIYLFFLKKASLLVLVKFESSPVDLLAGCGAAGEGHRRAQCSTSASSRAESKTLIPLFPISFQPLFLEKSSEHVRWTICSISSRP